MEYTAYTVRVERVEVQFHQTDRAVPTNVTRRMFEKGSENVSPPAMFSYITEIKMLPKRRTIR